MNKDLEKKILEVADLIYNTGYTAGSAENGPIGYDKGYKYGNKIGYDQGLNDAWECARKIYQDLSMDECIEIFEGKSWFDYNASEVIAKIKEYEEKQTVQTRKSVMTLDEAIKHCEEVAYQKDLESGFETDNEQYSMTDKERLACKECANEHRQLAEWLKELKELRKRCEVIQNCKCCGTIEELDS